MIPSRIHSKTSLIDLCKVLLTTGLDVEQEKSSTNTLYFTLLTLYKLQLIQFRVSSGENKTEAWLRITYTITTDRF